MWLVFTHFPVLLCPLVTVLQCYLHSILVLSLLRVFIASCEIWGFHDDEGWSRSLLPRCLRLQGSVGSLSPRFLLAGGTCRLFPVRACIYAVFSLGQTRSPLQGGQVQYLTLLSYTDWGFPCFSSVIKQMPGYKWKGARPTYTRPWIPSAEVIPSKCRRGLQRKRA